MGVQGKHKPENQNVKDEEKVPEKIRKVVKVEPGQSDNSEDDDSSSSEAEIVAGNSQDDQVADVKFPKGFKIRHFRKKLKGNEFIPELRYFVNTAKSKPDIIRQFMQKKGNPLELAEAFDRIDKSQLFHISYACDALQLVLMEIITNQQSQTEIAMNASRYFLRSNGNLVEKLLQSPTTEHRKSVIKLLTAIVCLEPMLGRQILTSFDFLTNTQSMEELLSHSKAEKDSADTVRKCYINFILSYLIDGNILLIRNLLDKYNLINALLSGLVFDDHVTVCVVLNTFKKFVLETLDISKTKKIHVFDVANLKHLIKLYQWRGPRYYAGMTDKIRKKGNLEILVDPLEKKAVAEAAHKFLEVLLTSRKYGVAFDAMVNFKEKYNLLQNQILRYIQNPWLDELKSDLVIKILKACPELARNCIRRYSICLNPTKTSSWEALFSFMEKLITELHPSVMRGALEKITQTDFFFMIKDICMCPEALINLKGSYALKSDDFKVRVATIKLLLAMFKQFCNYVNIILKREKAKGSDMRKFKFDVLNHIFVHFPAIQNILMSLYKSIKSQEGDDSNINVLEHLEPTLDIVLLAAKNCRSFVDKTSAVVDYIELLRPLYQSEAVEEYKVRLELKAVKTILLLIPGALKAHKKNDVHFSHIIQSFINALVHGSGSNRKEAGALLREILVNQKFFRDTHLEVDIWVEALTFISPKCLENVKQIFPKIIRFWQNSMRKKNRVVIKEPNADIVIDNLFENIENGNIIQGSVERISLGELMFMSLQYKNKNEDENEGNKNEEVQEKLDISEYLEMVSLLLFHYLPSPKVIQQVYNENFETHSKYMFSWLNKHKPGTLASKSIPKYSELYQSILSGEENFQGLFACPKGDFSAMSFILDGKEIYLSTLLQSERLVLIYIHLIIFVVTQLVKNSALDDDRTKSCLHYLLHFIKILAHLQENQEITEEIEKSHEEEKSLSYLELVLKYIYCNHLELLQGFTVFASLDSERNFLKFICELTNCINSLNLPNVEDFTVHYRSKIINQLAINLKNNDNKEVDFSTMKAFEIFQMNATNCADILAILTKLPSDRFYTPSSTKSLYFDVLIYVLNRLAELRTFKLNKEIVIKTTQIYIDLVKSSKEINLEKLEEAFNNLFFIAHQFIPHLPIEVFTSVFETKKITKSTVNLASIFLERRNDLNEIFLEQLAKNVSKKELVYPLLNVFLSKDIDIEEKLLGLIYQEYKNGFLKTVEKPLKAGVIYKENVEMSLYLIEKCMPISECQDFCKKILKADSVEMFQLKVIEKIYKKAIESIELISDSTSIFANFINTLVQLYLVIFRRDYADLAKLKLMSFMAYNWQKTYRIEGHHDFTKILTGQSWSQFYKNCLKLGMQNAEQEEEAEGVKNDIDALLLKTLTLFTDILYEDSSNDPTIQQMFEMVFSHSKFLDIVFTQKPTEVKTEVMHLLYVLVNKNQNMLESKHIPIFLGAYQAKLSSCDRYILALLQFYEKSGISLHEYRPFIWGYSAIEHYSLRDQEEKNNLQQQEPSVLQVMSIIDRHISDFTVENFPIWRKLNTLNQLPEIKFDDPTSFDVSFGSNKLERDIEAGTLKVEESFLRLCPKRDEIYDECYDPAFIIPLMSMAFAPEVYSQPVRPVQNGLLGIVFACFSSQDKEMRLAAGCIQLRYRQHFENTHFFDKPIWSQAYDSIQNGLHNLSLDWAKHKKSGIPRVPYISGIFLIKSINVLIDPNDQMYKTLSMYIRLKNIFNFLCVPEFNVLFHSSEIDHQTFRNFIVEVIRDGIKCSSDLFLLVTTNTFKALMGFYESTMSNTDVNFLILSVISTCCKIPASSKLLIEHVGVLPWINSVIEKMEFFHFNTVEAVISILSNLWYSVVAMKSEFYNFQHIESNIFHLLVKLSSKMSGRISLNNFVRFLNILSKTAHKNHKAMDEEILEKVINCAQRYFEEHIWYIKNLRSNGVDGAESNTAYVRRLKNLGLDNTSTLGLLSLRKFVLEWIRC